MAKGTQDLIAADSQATMNTAISRFAQYAESGVPTFGEDNVLFSGLHPFNLGGMATFNMFLYQTFGGFDSATTAFASAAAFAESRSRQHGHTAHHAPALGLSVPRGGEVREWVRPEVLLSSANCSFLERRLWSLLPQAYRQCLHWCDILHLWRRSDSLHELQGYHYVPWETRPAGPTSV